jgi:hypothetical protein
MEKLIFEIVANSVGKSQKGDVSQYLIDQGFFGNDVPKSLQNRNKQWSGGNPVDVKKEFFENNPN